MQGTTKSRFQEMPAVSGRPWLCQPFTDLIDAERDSSGDLLHRHSHALGAVLYQSAKDNLSAREPAILEGYPRSLDELNAVLDAKYRDFISGISEAMIRFMDILECAFAPDIRTDFDGSVELAKELGVPGEEILDSKRKLYSYFMD